LIKKYTDFLLESKLIVSEIFEEVLKLIDDPIARSFEELIAKDDINTRYNAITVSDQISDLYFIGDTQLQSKLNGGLDPEDVFTSGLRAQSTSITRITKQIFSDNNIDHYPHGEYVMFADKFKSAVTMYKWKLENYENTPIRVVEGEEIRDWYLEDNYCEKAQQAYGSLSKSCMRFEECQEYFNIYVNNPKKCKMVILTVKDEGKALETLSARALLWNTDQGWYLDRIYFTDPSELELIKMWVKEKYNNEFCYHGRMPRLSLILDVKSGAPFPYMDSMCYLNTLNNTLLNYMPDVPKEDMQEVYYLQDTEGGYESHEDDWRDED
jgi:hypothetical protein